MISGLLPDPKIFDPKISQKVGNTYFNSNGSSTQKVGNTYFHSNGSTTQKVGNTFFHND